jgi:hypothetical protein
VDRIEVLRELETMIVARLFYCSRWLTDRETAAALGRKLSQMGLEEVVPSDSNPFRATAFRSEQKLDLLMAFIGILDEWEVPGMLEQHGLIDETECEDLLSLLEAGINPEIALRDRVQKAYWDYYNPCGLLN